MGSTGPWLGSSLPGCTTAGGSEAGGGSGAGSAVLWNGEGRCSCRGAGCCCWWWWKSECPAALGRCWPAAAGTAAAASIACMAWEPPCWPGCWGWAGACPHASAGAEAVLEPHPTRRCCCGLLCAFAGDPVGAEAAAAAAAGCGASAGCSWLGSEGGTCPLLAACAEGAGCPAVPLPTGALGG